MHKFTIDTNCIIHIDESRPDAVHVRALADAHAAGSASVAIVAIAASEKQKGGKRIRLAADTQVPRSSTRRPALCAVRFGVDDRPSAGRTVRLNPDVDLNAGRLSVRGTLKVTKGRVYVDPPKTRKGRRTMTLPAVAVAALTEHRPPSATDANWIFADADGGPLRRANVTERSFRGILRAAGLPTIAFHELRHTHASLLATVPGLNPKIVQERSGHASIDMTIDTYSHLFQGADAEAVAGLDALDFNSVKISLLFEDGYDI